jgi:hypothetical protein
MYLHTFSSVHTTKVLDMCLWCCPADPDVEYAEPNFIYKKSQAATNDPYYSSLWGMLAGTPGGANAAGAWAGGHQNCDDVVIGVIDTGGG